VKVKPRRHTFVFIGFTDEEAGLVGSKFYVHQLSKDAVAKISAMVNLDSLGADATKVELTRSDRTLANDLAGVAQTLKLPLAVVNVHKVGLSDSDSFEDRKIPSINIHSLTTPTFPILHSVRDQINALRVDDYYDSYLLIRAYLAYLDQTLDAH
jgi:Zn-dependent M28 family amino/carboxypeptidase